MNTGVLCSRSACPGLWITEETLWTVFRGVRKDLGSRLSSEELGRNSELGGMEDSSSGDKGRRLEYPKSELDSSAKTTVSWLDSVLAISN